MSLIPFSISAILNAFKSITYTTAYHPTPYSYSIKWENEKMSNTVACMTPQRNNLSYYPRIFIVI